MLSIAAVLGKLTIVHNDIQGVFAAIGCRIAFELGR
jgi:hypothetical protein